MDLFREFKLGIMSYVEALRFMTKNRLWFYILYPFVLSVIMFMAGLAFALKLSGLAKAGFVKLMQSYNIEWINSSEGILAWLFALVFAVLFWFIYKMIGKYLVLILMSPLLAHVSDKTNKIISGSDQPFEVNVFVKNTFRGVVISLRCFVFETLLTLILAVLSFVPVLGIIAVLLIFFVSAYFYGFSMIDYSNERKALSISESFVYIKTHRGLAVANGLVFIVLFLIPFVGVTFGPILSVVAATLATNKIDQGKIV